MSGTSAPLHSRLPEILEQHEAGILQKWMNEQLSSLTRRRDLIKESEVRDESKAFLGEFRSAVQNHAPGDINAPGWAEMRTLLAGISRSRGARGFTPVETASFIFSLRGTLMDQLQASYGADAAGLAAEMQVCNLLLDKLGLFTTETALATREQVIKRQQEEMLELSTPVVRLFPGVLGLPLIGTLDSERTQIVMENLLQKIVETESEIAIIDITGVPTVDTLVAQHLLKTVAATRLMGADCIISGIRPQIAHTIVHLGIELQDVATKATLADALRLALHKMGMSIQKIHKDTGSGEVHR